jgi:hypothetical protein
MLTRNYQEAFVEILEIFNYISIEDQNKIPKKFKQFLKNNASTTYEYKINNIENFNPNDLRHETKCLLAMIYRNYLCDIEERKEFDNILKDNSNKLEEEKRLAYDPKNIFKTSENQISKSISNEDIEKTKSLIEFKESIFSKFINKIKKLLKRNKSI